MIDGVVENPAHPVSLLVYVMAGLFVGESHFERGDVRSRLSHRLERPAFDRESARAAFRTYDADADGRVRCKWRPGEFIARFNTDLMLMTDALSISLPQFFVTLVTLVASVAYMLYIDWLLALFLFVFAPVVNFVVAAFYAHDLREYEARSRIDRRSLR